MKRSFSQHQNVKNNKVNIAGKLVMMEDIKNA